MNPAGNLPGLDDVMAGGIPAAFAKTAPVGTTVSGTVDSIEARQQTDFDSGAPKFFDDGRPMMQIVIHLNTDIRDPQRPIDDGKRALYIKGKNIAALREASMRGLNGAHYPTTGDYVTAKFAEVDEPKRRGYNGAKLYTFEIRKGSASLDQAMSTATPVQTTQAPTTPVQTAPQLDVNQVRQLESMGKSPAEIAGFLGVPAETIQQVMQEQPPF